MENMKIRRHGDVILKTTKNFIIPTEVKLKISNEVHRGNNHLHFLDEPQLIGEHDNKKYLRVISETNIDHNEHGKGNLPVGDYLIEIQTEYDHLKEESKQVID